MRRHEDLHRRLSYASMSAVSKFALEFAIVSFSRFGHADNAWLRNEASTLPLVSSDRSLNPTYPISRC